MLSVSRSLRNFSRLFVAAGEKLALPVANGMFHERRLMIVRGRGFAPPEFVGPIEGQGLAGQALVAQMGGSGPGQYDVSAPLTAVFRAD